jgi:hypothetical protein
VSLCSIGNTGASCVVHLDGSECQAPDLDRSDQQQDEYRQHKSEFHEGLAGIFT